MEMTGHQRKPKQEERAGRPGRQEQPGHRSEWSAEECEAASVALRFVGMLLLNEGTAETLAPVADPDLYERAPYGAGRSDVQAGIGKLRQWATSFQTNPSEASQAVRADAVRLFLGPRHPWAAPWESVHRTRERMIFQDSTLDVRARYRAFGLEAKQLGREPDDSMALELEFLAIVLGREGKARRRHDIVEAQCCADEAASFYREHIGRWYVSWCNAVDEHVNTEFYRGVSLLTRGFLEELGESLA